MNCINCFAYVQNRNPNFVYNVLLFVVVVVLYQAKQHQHIVLDGHSSVTMNVLSARGLSLVPC